MDEKSLGKRQLLEHRKYIVPQIYLQEVTNNLGLTYGVGDTTLRFTILVLSKTFRIGDTKDHI